MGMGDDGVGLRLEDGGTHPHEEFAPEKTVPGIVGVVRPVLVELHWPLVTSHRHLTTG